MQDYSHSENHRVKGAITKQKDRGIKGCCHMQKVQRFVGGKVQRFTGQPM